MPEAAVLKTPLPAGYGGRVSFLSLSVINHHHDKSDLERKGFVVSYRLESTTEGRQGRNSEEILIGVCVCVCVSVHIWRPETDFRGLPSSLFLLEASSHGTCK